MDGDHISESGGLEEDLTHWKNMAIHYKNRCEQVEKDFEEFQDSSQMLERELESAVDQAERKNKDLQSQGMRLQLELERTRNNQLQADTRVSELESKVIEYRNQEEKLIKYIRDLEQKNDDLERSQRALLMSLGENEAKLNSAIERNAFLESEQDESGAMVQRLKDEKRDLLEEMKVRVPDNDKTMRHLVDLNKIEMESAPTSTPSSPLIIGANGNVPLTAPTRISAMNMVGDLLRKVGALESKLASCRNASRESPQPGDPSREAYRGRRISRGSTSPAVHNYQRV